VVGTRVVVRRLLADGRATDVLGVCTGWYDDALTLDSERDGPVRIPLADVVTGKPVPPRASVRARVPAREVELRSFAGWPEVSREAVGDWVLRSAPPMGGRLLKRANSVLAMGDPGMPVARAAAAVVAAYRRLDRRPLAQVEKGSRVEEALVGLGWDGVAGGESLTQLASVAQVVRRLPAPPDDVEIEEGPGRLRAVLSGGAAEVGASLDDEWLCVHSLEVAPDARRRGLGRLALAEALDWGAAQGARTVWLHVQPDNDAALGLYGSLGFRTHHANRYLAPADEVRA
jgi:ribosomal protein S18 acetylase RimI-like enzyme